MELTIFSRQFPNFSENVQYVSMLDEEEHDVYHFWSGKAKTWQITVEVQGIDSTMVIFKNEKTLNQVTKYFYHAKKIRSPWARVIIFLTIQYKT